ncbi:alanine racemase [Magnetovibrio blakemorei]|uniref:alanine racemase n=1 Tax=Magnetovibrio blakemorei TaxID=28181 RepID=UPI000A8A5C9A
MNASNKSQEGPTGWVDVCAAIAKATRKAGRPANAVTLVAVSKTHGIERIRPVLKAGQRVFGENRVQEAEEKWPTLRTEFADVSLHLIGPLQTNKVKLAVALFDVIESVDREKLARALAVESERVGEKNKGVFANQHRERATKSRRRAPRRRCVCTIVPR